MIFGNYYSVRKKIERKIIDYDKFKGFTIKGST